MPAATDRLSLDLPEADLQALRAAIQVLQDKLLPRLIDLDAAGRRELPKMGDKSVAFVAKALDYARTHPELGPAYLDLDEFGRDLSAVEVLTSLRRPLAQILDLVDDSMLLAGAEAYGAALAYYQSVKGAARANVAAAGTIAEDLRQRFPGRTARPAEPAGQG